MGRQKHPRVLPTLTEHLQTPRLRPLQPSEATQKSRFARAGMTKDRGNTAPRK